MSDAFPFTVTDVVIACKSKDRYFDLDAVRTPHTVPNGGPLRGRGAQPTGMNSDAGSTWDVGERLSLNPAGAPPLDWWIADEPDVWRRLILSMCPERVCTTCGKPSRRITEQTEEYAAYRAQQNSGSRRSDWTDNVGNRAQGFNNLDDGPARGDKSRTLGWTDCGHDTWRAGHVLAVDLNPDHIDLEGKMTVKYIVGDVRNVLATLEPNSVDLIMTSPPFLALRSYLPADHADKALEIGSEATPGEFIDTLLDVVEACERVLAPHGSLVFELGDSYSGSGGAGGDYMEGGWREGQEKFRAAKTPRVHDPAKGPPIRTFDDRVRGGGKGWPLEKSLTLIPELFRIALVYGFNPLTGRQTPRWRVRNVVRWCRPNPPVGALGDKFRPATTDLVVACKARDRYFDLDAVREVGTEPGAVKHKLKNHSGANPSSGWDSDNEWIKQNPAGAPPLDHWVIPTAPYKGAHYATYPPDLCVRPIKAMCPERVCLTCGKPSRRIVESENAAAAIAARHDEDERRANATETNAWRALTGDTATRNTTLGWTDCGHDTWRAGHVLDCFAGSGTTLAVAHGHGRDATGIDLDAKNAELAYGRLGMFLEVIDASPLAS